LTKPHSARTPYRIRTSLPIKTTNARSQAAGRTHRSI
jgi:hypothetical protein